LTIKLRELFGRKDDGGTLKCGHLGHEFGHREASLSRARFEAIVASTSMVRFAMLIARTCHSAI